MVIDMFIIYVYNINMIDMCIYIIYIWYIYIYIQIKCSLFASTSCMAAFLWIWSRHLKWLSTATDTAFRTTWQNLSWKEMQAPIRFNLQPSKAFCTTGWRVRNYGYRCKCAEAQHGSDGKQQVIECQLNVSCLSSEFDSISKTWPTL